MSAIFKRFTASYRLRLFSFAPQLSRQTFAPFSLRFSPFRQSQSPASQISRTFASVAAADRNCEKTQHVRCWHCQHLLDCETERFFCSSCAMIQPPVKCLNYFQYLGFPLDYAVNGEQLTARFKDLQRSIHPDKFAQKSPSERTYAQDQSSLVNKAYQTLARPLKRALYLLKLHGRHLDEEAAEMDAAFLAEIMERNETIAETTDLKMLQTLLGSVKKEIAEFETQLTSAFRAGDIETAFDTVCRMKYFVSMEDHINKRLGFD